MSQNFVWIGPKRDGDKKFGESTRAPNRGKIAAVVDRMGHPLPPWPSLPTLSLPPVAPSRCCRPAGGDGVTRPDPLLSLRAADGLGRTRPSCRGAMVRGQRGNGGGGRPSSSRALTVGWRHSAPEELPRELPRLW